MQRYNVDFGEKRQLKEWRDLQEVWNWGMSQVFPAPLWRIISQYVTMTTGSRTTIFQYTLQWPYSLPEIPAERITKGQTIARGDSDASLHYVGTYHHPDGTVREVIITEYFPVA